MGKMLKKYLCLFLVITIVMNCCGCTPLYMVLDELYGDEAVMQAEAVPYIGFSDVNTEGGFDRQEATEFAESESMIKEYSNDYFYNLLSPNEQMIYNAYLYAMEHGYCKILVDDKLANDAAVLTKVLEYLSFDSPLLEQNLRYEVGDFSAEYNVDIYGIYERVGEFTGKTIIVHNFDVNLWEKKLEAIEVAKQIVEELPADLREEEKAKKLYQYVAQNIKYKDYKSLETMEVKPYLYDALVKGKSHCDGYTNALSLLYNIAGIESLEKTYTSGTEEVGHTWNVFEVNGNWYNADATGISNISKNDRGLYVKRYFGYADVMQGYVPDKKSMYPECKKSLEITKLVSLKNAGADKFCRSIIDGLKSGEKQLIILLTSYDELEVDRQMQRVANEISGTVNWIVYPVIGDKTALYVYK